MNLLLLLKTSLLSLGCCSVTETMAIADTNEAITSYNVSVFR
jgi:hypothetical protein